MYPAIQRHYVNDQPYKSLNSIWCFDDGGGERSLTRSRSQILPSKGTSGPKPCQQNAPHSRTEPPDPLWRHITAKICKRK